MDNLKFVYKHLRFLKTGSLRPLETSQFVGRHGRAYHYRRGETDWLPSERGGYTMCFVYNGEGKSVAMGLAECSPKDSFCYKIGREIARGRAVKQLGA